MENKKRKRIYITAVTIVILCAAAAATFLILRSTTPEEQAPEKVAKYEAKTVELTNQADSMNYAIGLVNGTQVKMYYLHNDTTAEAISAFVDAMQNGYEGKSIQPSESALIGKQLGQQVKQSESVGLANNPAWTLNEVVFFQGFVNGLYNDTLVMNPDMANAYFESQYHASALSNDTTQKARTTIKGTCPSEVKQVTLVNKDDSLNYAFGYLNGVGMAKYNLAFDSTGTQKQEVITSVNNALQNQDKYSHLVDMGEHLGKTIREQEKTGLAGESTIKVNYALLKQGIINGLLGYEKQWSSDDAATYFENTMRSIKFGDSRAAGETFLAENAKKDGVTTTSSGLQYEVIKMGKGKKPTATDRVKVHYHGTLIDGTVFDSSVQRGEPIIFALTQVISGWTEALQLMPVGSKFKLYIPSDLAYGAQQAGQIPPYSTLIFEVELLGIE
jgi:FKBP-type peptidyl-prolyl cis-trans isomerase FklB